jgi:drug/metabolite transporter (DMT)-like permease
MVMAWMAFGDIPQPADILGLVVVTVGVLLVQLPLGKILRRKTK